MATRAITALARAGVHHRLHEYAHDPTTPTFGEEAATALAVDPRRVFKTLVADLGDRHAVGVVPVAAMLDLKALAGACDAKRAVLAPTEDAERVTGYVVGGISPIGQRRRLATVLDASAEEWTTIFCSGGRRGLEVELAPDELVEVTGATIAPIARWQD